MLSFIISCSPKQVKNVSEIKDSVNIATKNEKDDDTLYSLIAVGDIMMGTNYPYPVLPPDDGQHLFDDVKELLLSTDVTIGNLEGTLLNSGGTPKACNEPENCISFRMPEHYAGYLSDAGFDIMGLANNHSGDMGETGRNSTVETLDKYGILYAGYIKYPTAIFTKDGIRFGFAAFAPNTGTLSIHDLITAEKLVQDLKSKSDIVIINFHGGAEGSGATRVIKAREIFLGEDRGNVYEFAHAVIDAGADLVIGEGPHVPRAIELYKGHIIAYSLGNFCTYGKFGLSGALGYAPIINIIIDKNGKFIKGRIFSAIQTGRGIPVFDDENKAAKFISNLSKYDFYDNGLIIDDEGLITVNEKTGNK